ncbi:MAG: hypothetical protein WC389_16320 [Lutibacter sp.]|jgi:hypothetical protein
MGAELELSNQIAYIDSILFYNTEKLQACNPFLNVSVASILISIRKSLIELQDIKKKS